jgi:hypothetical protein
VGYNTHVHGSNARNLFYSYFYLKLAKCYVFLIISYVFSPTKLENKKVEQVLGQVFSHTWLLPNLIGTNWAATGDAERTQNRQKDRK